MKKEEKGVIIIGILGLIFGLLKFHGLCVFLGIVFVGHFIEKALVKIAKELKK